MICIGAYRDCRFMPSFAAVLGYSLPVIVTFSDFS
jgi:hypothetical protein